MLGAAPVAGAVALRRRGHLRAWEGEQQVAGLVEQPQRPLRTWQREALTAYRAAAARDFLVTATPGAGKTTFALTLAHELLDRRAIDRVAVVCPTDHLRTQWADAAARAGLILDPTLTNADGGVRPGAHGYVTTYAQVAGKPALHNGRCTVRRTLVVLDEVHHAGDGLSWGEAVEDAFSTANRRLCLTGTPFRTSPGERIPFVRYDDDGEGGLRSHADYTYGYREALAEGVVRPVVFAAYTGVSRWVNSAGEVIAASLSEYLTRDVEMAAWRTALDPRGEWVPHVIAAMDERLTQLRASGMPDAAGLVLASDQDDARAYAAIVERVTGEEPELILSDDPKASSRIALFNESDRRLAVCVRMVSEGVDVPRAACLAWLTSYRTPLFFAQAVGRVVRSRGPHESATVFLPAVRPLLALAAELEASRNHVITPPPADTDQLDPLPLAESTGPGGTNTWEALGAEAQFAHVLHAGQAHVGQAHAGEDQALTGEDEDFLGLPGLLTPEQTAALLARRDEDLRRKIRAVHAPAPVPPAAGDDGWRAVAELRREVNRLVGALSARTGTPHASLHSQLRAAVPGPPSSAASAEVLRARRDHLLSRL
jgi:superfamily II DNA or RNA helicase